MNYLVYGLGRSGVAVANFLAKNEESVYVYDDDKNLANELQKGAILSKNCSTMQKLCAKTLCIVHCIVLSPGVKIDKKMQKLIQEFKIEVIGELAFASKFCTAPIYAITGTNGKTSTVNYLTHIFEIAKFKTHAVGNIGNAFSNEVDKIAPNDKVVCEVSSFQLEYSQDFKARAVAFLNIAPDHLDRYKDFDAYFNAKKLILDRVEKNGKIFLNFDDEKVRALGEKYKNVEYFSLNSLPSEYNGVFVEDKKIYKKVANETHFVASLDKCKLIGSHNLSNLLCAISFSIYDGVLPQSIQKAINTIKPIPHRIEKVGELNGVAYYNDSKATNTNSTMVAVSCFDKNIWLLLGGSDKGENFKDLLQNLPQTVRHIVAFGKMGRKIAKIARKLKLFEVFSYDNLVSAFECAKSHAKSGEVVLLSPACASFDEFHNFEERGDCFKNLVLEK